MEIYFLQTFTLSEIEHFAPNLKVKCSFNDGIAFIYDSYNNFITIEDVVNKNTKISTVKIQQYSGGEFIVHDIALSLQKLFISETTYSNILEYLDENNLEFDDLTNDDIISYVYLDLPKFHLHFSKEQNRILVYNKSECLEKRIDAKTERDSFIEVQETIENQFYMSLLKRHKHPQIKMVQTVNA